MSLNDVSFAQNVIARFPGGSPGGGVSFRWEPSCSSEEYFRSNRYSLAPAGSEIGQVTSRKTGGEIYGYDLKRGHSTGWPALIVCRLNSIPNPVRHSLKAEFIPHARQDEQYGFGHCGTTRRAA